MKRRSAVVAVGMVLIGVIAAGVVSAAASPVKTSVSILNGNGERFTGRVTSPKKACIKGRKVTLYMETGSARRNYGGYAGYEAVGKATTKSNGNWEIEASQAFLEGNYRASVAAKRVTAGGETFLCMAKWGTTRHA
jgi:hypothetical protein